MEQYITQLQEYFYGVNITKFCLKTGIDRSHLDYVLLRTRRLKKPYIYTLQEAIITRQDQKQSLCMDLMDKKKYPIFNRKDLGND